MAVPLIPGIIIVEASIPPNTNQYKNLEKVNFIN
jgi:hypothetical protein